MIDFAPDNPFSRLLEAPPLQKMAYQALGRGRNFNQHEINRFRQHGVEAINLFKAWSTQVDWVDFNGEYFEFADEGSGEQVFTMGIISTEGLIDAVAYHPTTGRLAAWLGVGFALDEHRIADHLETGSTALAVYKSPLGWLRAGCDGIVIVRKSFTHIVLTKVATLIAEDESHGIELRQMFPAGATGPRIVVRDQTEANSAVKLEVAA